MLDKQQLISAISTSILTSDSSLQKNNMAPQFDLCPDFNWTWVMFPFCFSLFFLPSFSSSLLFSVHPYFSVYWYSACSSTSASQGRKMLHKLVQNLKLSVVIDKGCETENYPPLSSFSFFALESEVTSLLFLKLSTPSDRTVLTISVIVVFQDQDSHTGKILIMGFYAAGRHSRTL